MRIVGYVSAANYYGDPQNRLNGCVNDLLDWQSLLLKSGAKQKDITVVSDDPKRQDIYPSKENYLKNFERAVSTLKSGDVFVFTWSGHGSYTRDKNFDEKDGRDEVICAADGKNITDDELKAVLKKIPKGVNSFVFMDCCHSGSNLDLANSLDNQESNKKEDPNLSFVFGFAGCQDNQVSLDVLSKDKSITEKKKKVEREITQEVKKRGAETELRYRGAFTAAFMEVVEKRRGLHAIFEAAFSGSKTLMRGIGNDVLKVLKANNYPQVPRISYEGKMPVKQKAQAREPLLFNYGYRVGKYNLRQTPAREERTYTETRERSVRLK